MRRIADVADRELTWSQPSALKREYELRAGTERLAALAFRSSWGTLASAESGEGTWTFKRVGFWQSRASIREAGSETDLAVFRNNTWSSGGTLEFARGPKFRATTNLWQTRFSFQTESGELLVRFDYGGAFRRSARVETSARGRSVAELPLLVLFGWYLVIMLDSDADATIVAAMG
jgi:hypothetical protein